MKKTIIGLVGETGAGKDTVANYLEKEYGAQLTRFADPIKDTLSIYFDKLSKEDHHWLFMAFKERFGDDILCQAMKKRIDKENAPLIVINGLRMPWDYDFIRKLANNKIIFVTLDQEARWKRVASRGEKTDDAISFEKFKELDNQLTEVHVREIGAKADKIIINNKDLQTLYIEIDEFMRSIDVQKPNK